jgi:Acyltransferase
MTGSPQALITPSVGEVNLTLFTQLMGVMGLKHPSRLTRCIYPIFYTPIQRLSRLAVQLDRDIGDHGWNAAMNQFLSHFASSLELHGEDGIPLNGPVMVACNHPAALDVIILAAAIHRDDLKIVASDISIIRILPHFAEHCIPVYYDVDIRLHTIRNTIRHLENGGAILIFPRGNVEPDPVVSPGAIQSLSGWSPSVELFLRKVPQTNSVVAIASGMLSAGWYKNPLLNFWKKYEQRQKVAEIFQIASQLITGRTPAVIPTISFATPRTVDELGGEQAPKGVLLANLEAQARLMLEKIPAK